MTSRSPILLILVPVVLATTACETARRDDPRSERAYSVSQAPRSAPQQAAHGRVASITLVDGDSSGIGGAVLGAVLGGVIGHQIGGGTGRDVATGLGAVGGALIGRNLQKRKDSDTYRVVVRMEDGSNRSFDYRRIDDLGVGDRVRIEGGEIVRL
jgi:outer membrane lipoprotein SlyB